MDEIKRFTCKTCGADLGELLAKAASGVVKCPYCDSVWTVSKKQTSVEAIQFIAIGEHELDVCKFDEAFSAFKKAAEISPEEPEAFWGMALAEFKVQYLKDIVNNRMQPICHEISEKSFNRNKNYLAALSLATAEQKAVYKAKAEEIDEINDEFYRLKDSGLDYDSFICVKVTDENGSRTKDYERAFDIYYYLKEKGYTPFFSEIVLKGQTGADYEAHILYALATSETMLVVCENEDYLKTDWVKNEYTRFLAMIADEQKDNNTIAFVFNSKPIEKLPGAHGKLQGIDYSKPTAMASIQRFVEDHTPEARKKRAIFKKNALQITEDSLFDRIDIEIEDGEWEAALKICEDVLNANAKCGRAYLYKLLIDYRFADINQLSTLEKPFYNEKNYLRCKKFDEVLGQQLDDINAQIEERIKQQELEEQRQLEEQRRLEEQKRLEELEKLAKESNTDGVYYFKDKMYFEAFLCFEKAASQGYSKAQYNLGFCYEHGKGIEQNLGEASKWYYESALQGYAKAQHSLGLLYYKGQGVVQSDIEAFKWFYKSAVQGYAPAQYNLGWCYEIGEGVEKNLDEAKVWYGKAAEQGDKDAAVALNALGVYDSSSD